MKLTAKIAASTALSALAVSVIGAKPAQALNYSFKGTFASDNDVQCFSFQISSPSKVTLKTPSYESQPESLKQGTYTVAISPNTKPTFSQECKEKSQLNSQKMSVNQGTNPWAVDVIIAEDKHATPIFPAIAAGAGAALLLDSPQNSTPPATRIHTSALLPLSPGSPPDPAHPATPIPTPALLPGLIGLGLGVLRKRKAKAIRDSEV